MMSEPPAITSRANTQFKVWISLLASRGIDKHGQALVSGRKVVPELAASAAAGELLLEETMEEPQGFSPALRRYRLSSELFGLLDEFGTHAPLLVLPSPAVGEAQIKALPRGLTVAIAAQDPSNVGAILRSALAFGASAAILLREAANPFLPRATRSAAGANFRVPLLKGPSINEIGAGLIGLDLVGAQIGAYRFPPDACLVLGEEGQGLPGGFDGERVTIPIAPGAESLNVAVAAGIALAAYRACNPFKGG